MKLTELRSISFSANRKPRISMSEEKKNTTTTASPASTPSAASTPSKTAPEKPSTPTKEGVQNGKGDAPRNCFSDTYRSNFDGIDWSK